MVIHPFIKVCKSKVHTNISSHSDFIVLHYKYNFFAISIYILIIYIYI